MYVAYATPLTASRATRPAPSYRVISLTRSTKLPRSKRMAKGMRMRGPVLEMCRNKLISSRAPLPCAWVLFMYLASTARAEKQTLEAAAAKKPYHPKASSWMHETATPTQMGSNVRYVRVDARSCRYRNPMSTLEMGSPDLTVSAKLADTRLNAVLVKMKPNVYDTAI